MTCTSPVSVFFFNDTATTEIYTLSLHDALPIFDMARQLIDSLSSEWQPDKYHDTYRERVLELIEQKAQGKEIAVQPVRSEEHTSELQSRQYLVCRLLLEKKKKNNLNHTTPKIAT